MAILCSAMDSYKGTQFNTTASIIKEEDTGDEIENSAAIKIESEQERRESPILAIDDESVRTSPKKE